MDWMSVTHNLRANFSTKIEVPKTFNFFHLSRKKSLYHKVTDGTDSIRRCLKHRPGKHSFPSQSVFIPVMVKTSKSLKKPATETLQLSSTLLLHYLFLDQKIFLKQYKRFHNIMSKGRNKIFLLI